MTSILRRLTALTALLGLVAATVVGVSAPAAAAGTGVITGVVTDDQGAPLAGVNVQVLRHDGSGDPDPWDLVPGVRTTDDQGRFTWDGLEPGDYTVAYHPQDGQHVFEYWDDEATLSNAETVAVANGASVTANASLAPAAFIEGTVTRPGGAPVEGVTVYAWDLGADDPYQSTASGTETDAQGHFTLGGLRAGDYALQFTPDVFGDKPTNDLVGEWYDDARDRDAATPVTVATGETVDDLDVQLDVGGSITGTVSGEGTGPLEGAEVEVFEEDQNGYWNSVARATTTADGEYTVRAIEPGSYAVRYSAFADGWAQEYWDGTADRAASQLLTLGVAETETRDVTLQQGATFSGTVSGELDGASVTLDEPMLEAERLSSDGTWEQVTDIRGDASGAYSATGLATGTYRFLAFGDATASWAWRYVGGAYLPDDAATYELTAGQEAGGPATVLEEGVSISGTLYEEDGSLISGEAYGAVLWERSPGEFVPYANGGAAGDPWSYHRGALAPGNYKVEFVSPDGDYAPQFWDQKASLRSATVIEAAPGSSHDGIDAHLWTEARDLTAPAGLQVDPQVTPERGSVALVWDPVADATSYQVVLQPVGGGDPVVLDATEASVTASGLPDDASYDVTVTASSPFDVSPASASLRVTTLEIPDAPAAPTGLAFEPTETARGTVSLSWDSVPGADSYEVVLRPAGGGEAVVVASDTDSTTVTGLADDTTYDVTVTASNLGGTSPASAVLRVTTLGAGEVADFTDVPADHVFAYEMAWLASTGVTTGYDDGTFRPGQPVLREQMAAFLYRMAGSPSVELPADGSPFTDVATSHVFYEEIVWLSNTGITTGYDNGDGTTSFAPSQPVLREQMAAFLYRFAGRPTHPTPTSPPFTDVLTSHVFATEIDWLASTGITTGYDDGTYRISAPVLREQMAAFLYRFRQL